METQTNSLSLVEFYKSVLEAANVSSDENGLLSLKFGGSELPFTLGDKRLVLPLDKVLREPSEQRLVFHPLSESSNLGESDVLKRLKDAIHLRMMQIFQALVSDLGTVAASTADHKKLGAKAAKFLDGLGDFNETARKALESVLRAIGKDPEKRLFSIYLKRSSKDDDVFIRKAVVSFPIFDQFEVDDKKIFDVKMPRNGDKALIKKLFEYVMGDEQTRTGFSYGSMDREAPYLHALLTAFYRVASHTNALVKLHAKHLSDPNELLIDLTDWPQALSEFSRYRGVIPAQKGNKGAPLKTKKEKTKSDAPGLDGFANRSYREEPVAESDGHDLGDDIPFDNPQPRRDYPAANAKRVERAEEPAKRKGSISIRDFMNNVEDAKKEKRSYWDRDTGRQWGDRDRDRGRGRDYGRGGRDSRPSHRGRDSFL
ncbi:hypothetical protein ACLPJK_26245 [Pseudomonas aeruginosa]|uniref:hypothetical protein n=1 Tax=Pseudomonas aeruginosa TaxID=287 RepID=UPI003D294A83